MCSRSELVPIPDLLWDAGAIYEFDPTHPEYGIDAEGRKCLALDACIVPAIKALWDAGVVTMSCCCGHGDPWGVITIQTETSQGRQGAMVVRVEEYDRLTAELAFRKQQIGELIDQRDALLAAADRMATAIEEHGPADILEVADAYRALRGQPAGREGVG